MSERNRNGEGEENFPLSLAPGEFRDVSKPAENGLPEAGFRLVEHDGIVLDVDQVTGVRSPNGLFTPGTPGDEVAALLLKIEQRDLMDSATAGRESNSLPVGCPTWFVTLWESGIQRDRAASGTGGDEQLRTPICVGDKDEILPVWRPGRGGIDKPVLGEPASTSPGHGSDKNLGVAGRAHGQSDFASGGRDGSSRASPAGCAR